jgi:hypothetical protein
MHTSTTSATTPRNLTTASSQPQFLTKYKHTYTNSELRLMAKRPISGKTPLTPQLRANTIL